MNTSKMRWFTGIAATVGLLGLGAVGAPGASAQSAPPPTLTGEHFTISAVGGGGTCGSIGSFSFTVSGTATGPYPGTFTETGSGTVTGPTGDVLQSLTATFTINPAVGFPEVTGTKTLTSQQLLPCYQDPSNFDITANLDYQATIHTSQGNYADQGMATFFIAESSGSPNEFDELFTSSQTQTTLIEPESEAQCKHGGYKNFPQFTNQQQCIAYVKTH